VERRFNYKTGVRGKRGKHSYLKSALFKNLTDKGKTKKGQPKSFLSSPNGEANEEWENAKWCVVQAMAQAVREQREFTWDRSLKI